MPRKRGNEMKTRNHWIGAPAMFNLNQCCRPLVDAFGQCIYLVGSATEKRDYRDVDVRVILDDEAFNKMFPCIGSNHQLDAMWSVICTSISEWLGSRTGLLIDFQIQKRTLANEEFKTGDRIPLGLFIYPTKSPTAGMEIE